MVERERVVVPGCSNGRRWRALDRDSFAVDGKPGMSFNLWETDKMNHHTARPRLVLAAACVAAATLLAACSNPSSETSTQTTSAQPAPMPPPPAPEPTNYKK